MKKELEYRISVVEKGSASTIGEMSKKIKANFDHLLKMEKRLELQEDFDFEQLQTEVGALTAVIGDVEDDVKTLRAVDKRQHDHVVREIRRIDDRIHDGEKRIHGRFDHQGREIHNVTGRVDVLEEEMAIGRHILEAAAADRRQLHNETARLDDKLDHVNETTMKSFEEVEAKLAKTAAKLDAVVGKEDTDAADVDALTKRANQTDARLDALTNQADATLKGLESLNDAFHHAVTNVSAVLAQQEGEIGALKQGQVKLESAVGVAQETAGQNSKLIAKNDAGIEQLRKDLSDQGAKVAANGEAVAALGKQLQQLSDGLEALRSNLQQHRTDVVEEMKRLTAAIAN